MATTVIWAWLTCLIISVPFISGISMSISIKAGRSLCKVVRASTTWPQANTRQESSTIRRNIS